MFRLFLICLVVSLFRLHAAEVDAARVFLLGQVTRPDTYMLSNGERDLYHLVSKAGGPTQAARWGQGVDIIREVGGKTEKKRHAIDVHRLMKEGASSALNRPIRHGDVVIILERVM